MSQENVEIVRRGLELNQSAQLPGAIDTIGSVWHPDCEFTSVMGEVDQQMYRGHEGIRRYLDDMAEAWKEWRLDVNEVVAVAPDTVVATFTAHLVAKESGVPLENQRAFVAVLSQGKVLRARVYPSRKEALEAVGLSE